MCVCVYVFYWMYVCMKSRADGRPVNVSNKPFDFANLIDLAVVVVVQNGIFNCCD